MAPNGDIPAAWGEKLQSTQSYLEIPQVSLHSWVQKLHECGRGKPVTFWLVLRPVPQKGMDAWYWKSGQTPMARELISHREEPLLLLFCQEDIVWSCLLNLYLSTHKSVHLSVLTREVTLCSRRWFVYRLTTGLWCKEVSVCGVLCHKWSMSITLPWSGLREHCGGRDRMIVRDSSKRNDTQQCLLDTAGRASINAEQPWLAEQDQTSQHSIMHRGGTHKPPPPAEELWQLRLLGRDSQFSLEVWPLVSRPCSITCPHTHGQPRLDSVSY